MAQAAGLNVWIGRFQCFVRESFENTRKALKPYGYSALNLAQKEGFEGSS